VREGNVQSCLGRLLGVGKAVEGYRSPRRFATGGVAGKSARFWSAPVLWRFGNGREMDDGRNLVLIISLITLGREKR
jgi:hypothetical protein